MATDDVLAGIPASPMLVAPSWPLLAAWQARQMAMAQLVTGGRAPPPPAPLGPPPPQGPPPSEDVFPMGGWVCPARVAPSRAIVEGVRRGSVPLSSLLWTPSPAENFDVRHPKRAKTQQAAEKEEEEEEKDGGGEEGGKEGRAADGPRGDTGGFEAAVAVAEARNVDTEDVGAEVGWLSPDTVQGGLPDRARLWGWVKEGKGRIGVEGEDRWCDWKSIDGLIRAQMSTEGLEGERREDARGRSNEWEGLKEAGGMFMNRGGLKLAETDARCEWRLTRPEGVKGPDELLFFGEVGGGPGAWAEYVLWRKRGFARGLGMTLAGPDDYRCKGFHREAPYETLERVYGADGTGDVCSGVNLRLYFSRVAEVTEDRGLHLFLADAGWAGDGRGVGEQEVDNKQLLVAEVLAALGSLGKGGNFVLKVYDLLTDFSVGLLWMLRALFDKVGVFKPRASKPTAAERQVVCLGLRERAPRDVIDYLFRLLDRFTALKDAGAGRDVLEIVPPAVMEADAGFRGAVLAMNDGMAASSCRAARRLLAFHEDPELVDEGQWARAVRALEAWKVPVGGRDPREVRTPDAEAAHCILHRRALVSLCQAPKEGVDAERRQQEDRDILRRGPGVAPPLENEAVVAKEGSNQKPWYRYVHNIFMAVSTGQQRGFLVGCGALGGYACEARTKDGVEEDRWRGAWFCDEMHWKLDDAAKERPWRPVPGLVLPRGTLLEAEIASEYHPVVGSQGVWRRRNAFHVLDAVTVSGVDVREWPFQLRMRMVRGLCQAILGAQGAPRDPKKDADPAAAGPQPPQEVLLRPKEWHALAKGPQRIMEGMAEAPPRPREGWPKVLGEATAGPWISAVGARSGGVGSRSAPRWPAVRLLFKETQQYHAPPKVGAKALGYLATSRTLRFSPLWLTPPDAPFSLPGLERFASHWARLRHPQDPTGQAAAYAAFALEQLDGAERLLATPIWIGDAEGGGDRDDTQWT